VAGRPQWLACPA